MEKEAVMKVEKMVPKREKVVLITFKQNRKYDLHVGRNMILFMGRETKPVPHTWIKHKDFEQVKGLFIIKGV